MHKLKFKSNKTLRSLEKETLKADKFKIATRKKPQLKKVSSLLRMKASIL